MDPLNDLLSYATSSDASGEQRVTSLIDQVRALDGADLAALEQSAVSRFTELHNNGEYDPTQVATLEALADVTDAVRAVQGEQQAEQTERDTRVAQLADRVRTSQQSTENQGDPDTSGTTGEGQADPGTVDPPADQPDTTGTGEPPADTTTTEPPASGEPAGDTRVAASAGAPARRTSTPPAVKTRSRTTPAPEDTTPLRSFTITASAEVPNLPIGKKLTMPELAEAALARYGAFPEGQPTSGPMQANVARINREYAKDYTLTGDHADIAIIDKIADEKRLPGGSLVAASQKALTAATTVVDNDVWCSPSETDYSLCPPLATTEGMLDLPATGMPRRGGIRYPVWSQYPDAAQEGWRGQVVHYDQGLDDPNYFHAAGPGGTPAAGVGYPKKSISGPCVTWVEERQSLAYLNIISDILRDRTYPELTERFIDDVLVHHRHFLNETYIGRIVAKSDPIPAFSVQNGAGSIGSTSATVTDRLALLVTWFRNAYRMTQSATLEFVAPSWFREYLKRDIEKKQNRPHGTVSNAEIGDLFAQYSSRVQWVYDWQDIPNGTPVGPADARRVMPPDSWPTSVQLLAYPAGSWVLAESNVLTLGVQYDYQLLQENRYSSMFTEDAWLLLNRCNRSFVVELTELCANGAVGPQRDTCPPTVTTAQGVFLASGPGSDTTSPLPTQEVAAAATTLAATAEQTDTGEQTAAPEATSTTAKSSTKSTPSK